jgi:hypothetical protein
MTRDDEGSDDVLSQVRKALDDLDLGSASTRDALVEGVREALGSVQDALRPTPEGKPDLRVVPDEHDPDADPTEPKVTVRWVNKSVPASPPVPEDDWLGAIVVPGGAEDAVENWQTVSHSHEPRPYRLRCTGGTLEVLADGAPIARVAIGQTVDVEASSIRVRGVGGPAHGTYDRL